MKRFTQYLCLFGGFVVTFLLGAYADAAIRHGEYISPDRWLINAFSAVFFFYLYSKVFVTRSIGWTTEIPTNTGWYVVKERMQNGFAEWDRVSLMKLERRMFKMYIATDSEYPMRLFRPEPNSGVEYLRLEGV